MSRCKPLPEFINGFRVIEDLGTKIHSGKKRRFARFQCKVCFSEFICQAELIRRKGRVSCSHECANKYWLDNLKESSGFKIISVGELIKEKRKVVVECPHCLKHFQSSLQSLTSSKQCGCLDYGVGYPKRLMRIKKNMIERCYNPSNINYCRYGARGIKICEEWIAKTSDFFKWALANGYNENLSLDRINNNGNYEPNNCRWATRLEQMANTRSKKKEI